MHIDVSESLGLMLGLCKRVCYTSPTHYYYASLASSIMHVWPVQAVCCISHSNK